MPSLSARLPAVTLRQIKEAPGSALSQKGGGGTEGPPPKVGREAAAAASEVAWRKCEGEALTPIKAAGPTGFKVLSTTILRISK